MSVERKLKANALVQSTATMHDHMPKSNAPILERPGQPARASRPFACLDVKTSWFSPDHIDKICDPDLIYVTSDGNIHYKYTNYVQIGTWGEEVFFVERLKNSKILSVRAHAFSRTPDGTQRKVHFVVFIVAQEASGRPCIVVSMRDKDGWREIEAFRHLSDGRVSAIADGTGLGSFGLVYDRIGSNVVFYSVPPRGMPSIGIAIHEKGDANDVQFGRDGQIPGEVSGTAHFISMNEKAYGLIQPDQGKVRVLPFEGSRWTGRIEFQGIVTKHPQGKAFEKSAPIGSVSRGENTVPILDGDGVCAHFLVFDDAGRAVFSAIDEWGGVLSAVPLYTPEGPQVVKEMAYTVSLRRDAQDAGTLNVFARDANDEVWHTSWKILRATRRHTWEYVDPDTMPGAIKWEATGCKAKYLSAPREFTAIMSVFAGLDNGEVIRISRATDRDWTSTKIAVMNSLVESEAVPVHVIQVSSVTAQADLVADVPLEVSVDKDIQVEFEGKLIQLTPAAPFSVKTNAMGNVRFKMRAEDNLEAPVFTVTSPGLKPARFDPQRSLLRRLAGYDPTFPLDPARLKAAKLMPEMSPPDAERFVGHVKTLAKEALKLSDKGDPSKASVLPEARNGPPTAFSVVFEGGRFTVKDAAPAARRAAEPNGPGMPGDRGSGADPSIREAWSGFWGWVTNGWTAIREIGASTVEGIVEFVVKVGEEVKSFLVDTVRRAGQALTCLFDWITKQLKELGSAAKRLVQWVAAELGWADVVRAKNVVRQHTLKAIQDLEVVVGRTIPNVIAKGIDEARSAVSQHFDAISQRLGGETAGPQAGKTSIRSQAQNDGATILSVQHSIPNEKTDRPLFEPSEALIARMDKVVESAKGITQGDALKNALESLQSVIQQKASVEDALSLVLKSLVDTTKRVIELTLDVANVVQTAIFELIAGVIGLVRQAITKPIVELSASLRWVNTLYKSISGGSDLDVLDLSCLAFVAPGVLIHHMVKKRNIVEADVPEADVATVIGGVPRLLASDAASDRSAYGEATHGANPVSSGDLLSEKVRRFYAIAKPVFDCCNAVWTFLMSPYSVVENFTRLAEAKFEGVGFNPNWRMFHRVLVGLVAFATFCFYQIENVFLFAGEQIDRMIRESPQRLTALLVNGCLCIGMVAAMLAFFWNDGVKTVVSSSWLWAIVWGIVGVATIAWTIYRWATQPEPSDQKERTNYHLGRVAQLLEGVRKCLAWGVPLGGRLMKGDPASITVGGVIAGVNIQGDQLINAANGILLSVRAFA